MLPVIIRGIIIYIFIIATVRLMGKRQIGELQPSELVVTMLLSEIAAMPLQDSKISLIQSLTTIFLLAALEVIASVLALKSEKFRTLLQGHSVMVIKNGKIIQQNMKLIRFSVEDLIEALRLKDVFDISTVDYAYIETNGSLSVLLNGKSSTVTASDLNIEKEDEPLTCLVISDGKIINREFGICDLDEKKLLKILKKKHIKKENILLMTYSSDGKTNIVEREKSL